MQQPEAQTITLATFLLQRIAEDEEAAREAALPGNYPHFGDSAAEECLDMAVGEGCSEWGTDHFRRHMPARVLAECEAKRAIVELHQSGAEYVYGDGTACTKCGDVVTVQWPCATLLALARPYADHPDFDRRWRP